MRFLVIGLGSMGKRRIKCLQELGYTDILGFDTKGHERWTANVTVVDSLVDGDFDALDMMLICTPPDQHTPYIKMAIEKGIPAFVEQSVVLQNLEELIKKTPYIIIPSNTMYFHPVIDDLFDKKVLNFSYHVGQYLPDWHPGARFFAHEQETSGCRELLAFELNWITSLLGIPNKIYGFHGKTTDIGADIDDTYVVAMDWGNCYGSMTVDVVSRIKTRHLIVNTPSEQIVSNLSVSDDIYIKETKAMLAGAFPNDLKKTIGVLKLLEKIENG